MNLIKMRKERVEIGIRDARKRVGMTQEELAATLGVDQTSIVAWERGKWSPRTKLLPTLAKVLRTTVDDLLAPDGVNDDAGDDYEIDAVEEEIKRLRKSEFVKLAQDEIRLRAAKQREMLCSLRRLEERGKQLAQMGVSRETQIDAGE